MELIRTHGLKSRMCEPQELIKKINRLSMEMTHTRRRKNSNKERKRVLREMKKLVVRSEGFENRALQVAWGVLTHDLWVLAEKLREQRRIREKKLGQAA
jgi:hypothetical protein